MSYFFRTALAMAALLTASLSAQMADSAGSTFFNADAPGAVAMDLHFKRSAAFNIEKMKRAGMRIQNDHTEKGRPFRTLSYTGVPAPVKVTDGDTILFFYKDKLYRIGMTFKPTYVNYLILNKQLTSAIGGRFVKEKDENSIEPMLKAQLAFLKPGEYDADSEKAIRKSMVAGRSFFFQKLADTQGEIAVTLTFRAAEQDRAITPRLQLLYTDIELEAEIEEYMVENVARILPQ